MLLELRWHGAGPHSSRQPHGREGTSEKEKTNSPERSGLAQLDELKGEDNDMSPPRGRSVIDCETLKSLRRWAAIEEQIQCIFTVKVQRSSSSAGHQKGSVTGLKFQLPPPCTALGRGKTMTFKRLGTWQIPSIHRRSQAQHHTYGILMLGVGGRQRHEDLWGLLASLSS